MTVEFIPPAKPIIGKEEQEAVTRVLASGMLAQGQEVAAFEEEFADLLSPGYEAIAVNSGTSGLHLGLLAAGIGPGDEVIVPAFTFAATGNAVALTGATPVFADIDLQTYNLCPNHVRELITPRTKGIMPVHLYGQAADMTEFVAIAAEHDIMLFEDAAQAHGATWDDKHVGTFGTFGVFSFYPTKNMTSGEGGMVTVRDPELARRVRLLRNQGMERQYHNEIVGFNNRMTDVHAAIGRVQLQKLQAWTQTRQANAAVLNDGIRITGKPFTKPKATHVYHQYTVLLDEALRPRRGIIREQLEEEFGIGTGIYYPVATNALPSFSVETALPNTVTATTGVLSLPVHPSLDEDQLQRIVDAINTVCKAK
jgi:dTDP-4-amino-4,6-dideoxygalactose transaminase